MRSFLLLICLAVPLAAQEKTYDLSLQTNPKAGHKSTLAESSQMSMKMTANGMEVPASEEKKLFEATEVVVSTDGDGNGVLQRTYTKALRLLEGSMKPYRFQGRTVKITMVEDQPDKYEYVDGSEMPADELAALKGSFSGGNSGGGDDDEDNPLKPPKRMRVGETWSPDIRAVAKMFDEDMAQSLDVSKSKAEFTLRSVEKRKGIEFGKIDGVIELALTQMGPVELSTPIMLKMRLDVDACLDGTVPDGVLEMSLRMRGTSGAMAEGTKMNIDIDMTANNRLSRKTIK